MKFREAELAIEVDAPAVVWLVAGRQGSALGAASAVSDAGNQAVAVEGGVDGALGSHPEVTRQTPDQKLAQLAGAPVRLVALEADDKALDLGRELVGVAPAGHRLHHRYNHGVP